MTFFFQEKKISPLSFATTESFGTVKTGSTNLRRRRVRRRHPTVLNRRATRRKRARDVPERDKPGGHRRPDRRRALQTNDDAEQSVRGAHVALSRGSPFRHRRQNRNDVRRLRLDSHRRHRQFAPIHGLLCSALHGRSSRSQDIRPQINEARRIHGQMEAQIPLAKSHPQRPPIGRLRIVGPRCRQGAGHGRGANRAREFHLPKKPKSHGSAISRGLRKRGEIKRFLIDDEVQGTRRRFRGRERGAAVGDFGGGECEWELGEPGRVLDAGKWVDEGLECEWDEIDNLARGHGGAAEGVGDADDGYAPENRGSEKRRVQRICENHQKRNGCGRVLYGRVRSGAGRTSVRRSV